MPRKRRGEEEVKSALIETAAQKLTGIGPTALRVREVAELAGVNYGQVYHYFGGKTGLLKAAMTQLAEEHWRSSHARQADGGPPPELSLAEDQRYWQAIVRATLEGQLDLVAVEIERGTSVPREYFEQLFSENLSSEEQFQLRAEFAMLAVSQLGWVSFEKLGFLLTDTPEEEQAAVREYARRRFHDLSQALISRYAKTKH